jgi:hypothetical protein
MKEGRKKKVKRMVYSQIRKTCAIKHRYELRGEEPFFIVYLKSNKKAPILNV